MGAQILGKRILFTWNPRLIVPLSELQVQAVGRGFLFHAPLQIKIRLSASSRHGIPCNELTMSFESQRNEKAVPRGTQRRQLVQIAFFENAISNLPAKTGGGFVTPRFLSSASDAFLPSVGTATRISMAAVNRAST